MYIEPNTIIKILKNCPLDTTYDHTIFFDTQENQTAYFNGLVKYTLNNQTYQRVNKNRMRVQYKADDLYDCNYIMFQNTSYGNKWFYAFIKSVEYINNITSEIEYEIDVMQTWFFDYTLGQCFVEREHSATDNIGDNLVPENLEQGEYIENGFEIFFPENYNPLGKIVFVTTFNNDDGFTDFTGDKYNGVYSGLNYIQFSSAAQANSFLNDVIDANKIDGIINVFMSPVDFDLDSQTTGNTIETNVSTTKHYDSLDGYTPKNNKLFTYPYNILHIYTDSNDADYRYEFFNKGECTFTISTVIVPEPTLIIWPTGYKCMSPVSDRYQERLTLSNYPTCAFNSDVYKVYLAQNATSLPVKMIGQGANTLLSGIAGFLTGGVAGAVSGAISGVTSVATEVAQLHDISTKPPQANGTQSSASNYTLGLKSFWVSKLTITAEFAKIIDDYFTMFGYKTHRVKVPNRNVRPNWTYTKTHGCVIHGSVPCDDINKICHIYNNGITFWTNGENIGNYSLDNRPR